MRAWITVLLAWLFLATSALAENRLALVIGNDGYQHIAALQKAKADAKSYADLLREKGYSVQEGYDLGFVEMLGAVARFAKKILPGDTAVFIYSGHGWSDGSTNYIVGVDAPASEGQEVLTSVSLPIRNGLTGVLDDFTRKGAGLKVAIIDACRDNPFQPPPGEKGYGLERGLRPQSIEGSFVIYSAGEGQAAMDRLSEADADPNSVFTRTLLPLLRADLPLTDAIKASQDKTHALAASADHNQIPAYYDEVLGRACLSAACKSAVEPRPNGEGAKVDPPLDPKFAEARLVWQDLQSSTSVPLLQAFAARYADTIYANSALERIAELKRREALNVPPPKPVGPCGGIARLASLEARGDRALSVDEACELERGDLFRECVGCPEMVVLPPGTFTMGSPDGEKGRFFNEGPRHDVTFARKFAVGEFQVTKDEFAAFVKATGYDAGKKCRTLNDKNNWVETDGRDWENPGFAQTGSHPVACVGWDDAKAYVEWLAERTKQPYRLLSEAEWEYAARGRTEPGTYPRYFFGDDESDFCKYGKGADQATKAKVPGRDKFPVLPCTTPWAYTAPVGSFKPNDFGLYEMAGNVWQWVEDCWHDKYDAAPKDGSAWTEPTCGRRSLRGGSWSNFPAGLRAAYRIGYGPGVRDDNSGFRVARTLLP
jgi:formylglycine-generating enzyme required for sulfatase activity